MSPVAAHLKVSGLVQGVGFRYFCLRKAQALKLVGWVRNRPDGSVELVVEGERDSVELYLAELSDAPAYANVDNIEVEWLHASNDYKAFEVTG